MITGSLSEQHTENKQQKMTKGVITDQHKLSYRFKCQRAAE